MHQLARYFINHPLVFALIVISSVGLITKNVNTYIDLDPIPTQSIHNYKYNNQK